MNRNIKRVAFALIVSAGSFFGTVIWFKSGQLESRVSNSQPIATLKESKLEVQRKPQRRVIWENVNKNDNLFAGETVRTSTNAEAEILLIKSNTIIKLESDSQVILEENEKGLSLNFLEGNLYVQSSGQAGDDAITLKSGNSELKLNSADLSLSKEQSGAVSMAVFKGQAELQQGGKKIALDKETSATLSGDTLSVDKDRIQITWPKVNETVLLNLVRNEPLEVRFKALPPGYTVGVEWGKSRSKLQPLQVTAAGDQGRLQVESKSGQWYMKVVATSSDPALPPMSSIVFAVKIDPKAAPTLVEPIAAEPFIKGASDGAVKFRWTAPHKYLSQVLEVASDKNFKDIKIKRTFEDSTAKHDETLPEGWYFWRVTGYIDSQGKQEALTSPIVRFMAKDKWELQPPVLSWPSPGQLLTYGSTQREGVILKWQAPSGVQKFEIQMFKKNGTAWETIQDKQVDVAIAPVVDPKPGQYRWRVASVHPETGAKKYSKDSQFVIGDIPKIDWADTSSLYEFTTEKPTLRAQWKALERAPSKYRFRVQSADKPAEKSPDDWSTTEESSIEKELPAEGQYTAFVEAVNERGQVIAQSEGKAVTVKKFLLLPPPNWSSNTPETLQTDAKGNLSFAWEPVSGAEEYVMVIEDFSGKKTQQRLRRTTASVSKLTPGQYKVHLRSVDSKKRVGDKANTKALVVPATSDINAPKFKSMKVK